MRIVISLSIFVLLLTLFLDWQHQESILHSFLHQRNRYVWLGQEQPWAKPDFVDPQTHGVGFEVDPPVGYFQLVIIPRHMEVCETVTSIEYGTADSCLHDVSHWVY